MGLRRKYLASLGLEEILEELGTSQPPSFLLFVVYHLTYLGVNLILKYASESILPSLFIFVDGIELLC